MAASSTASDDGALVLPWSCTRPLALADALVAWIPPQQVSKLVRLLDGRTREPQACAHLKRVSNRANLPPGIAASVPPRLAVLLCIGGVEMVSSEVQEFIATAGAEPHVVQVPAHAPLTRQQFEEWGKVWPLHFHEAASTHSLAVWNEAAADASERDAMRGHMRRAIALAEENVVRGGRAVAAARTLLTLYLPTQRESA